MVEHYVRAAKSQWEALEAALPVRDGVSSADIVRAYLGLLLQGKSDFDAVEGYRGDKFFKEALGIELVASGPTLRHRLDAQTVALFEHVRAIGDRLLKSQRPAYGVLPCGWLPLGVDTFAMNNAGTAKEGVGRTYAGVDGYCTLAAYLGSHGFCLELALRPGVQHSARETDFNLVRVVPLAQRLSAAGPKAPVLARLDAGFDSAALMRSIEACNQVDAPRVDWLMKWNPRGMNTAAVLARLEADPATVWQRPRTGKRVAAWEEPLRIEGPDRPLRRVMLLVERELARHGQQLLVPEVQIEGWSTSLGARQFDAQSIIALYADHGTHEQFHSEFKTDMDLERLPSGMFDTNHLVCQLAAVAMNILRLMGQRGLLGPDAPVRRGAKRRRIKTVMQDLIYRAGRIIEHGRKLMLGLGRNDRGAQTFKRLSGELFAACA